MECEKIGRFDSQARRYLWQKKRIIMDLYIDLLPLL